MTAQNQLIESLPRADRLHLIAACEPVWLLQDEVLALRGQTLKRAHFPLDGAISLTIQTDAHLALEVGLVGREGMLGAHGLLGATGGAPTQAAVQSPGAALRIGAPALRRELARSAALRRVLGRYIGVHLEQLALAVACRRFHLIGPRLARWLLMTQDRAAADHFHVTHEFLAQMLGVRRVGITMAAGELQRAGLIRYHRGELAVLDRPGLEAAACSCYAADGLAYRRRMG